MWPWVYLMLVGVFLEVEFLVTLGNCRAVFHGGPIAHCHPQCKRAHFCFSTTSIPLDNIVQLQSSCFLCFVLFCFLRWGEWCYVVYEALASFLNLLSLRITDVCLPPFLEAILFTKGLFV